MADIVDKKKSKSGLALGIAIGVVAIWTILGLPGEIRMIASGVGSGRPDGWGVATGSIFGASLFVAGLVWLVMYFGFVRRSAPQRGGRYFLILWGIAITLNVLPVAAGLMLARSQDARDIREGLTAVKEMRSTLDRMGDPSANGPIDTHVKTTGQMGGMEGLIKQLAARVTGDRQAYEAELDALGFPNFMTPAALAANGGLAVASARLTQAGAVVEKYRKINLARLEEFHQAGVALPPSAAREGFLEAVETGMADKVRQVNAMWDLERSILGECRGVVSALSDAKGQWQISGKTFVFARQSDLDAYKRHIAAIDSYSEQEQAMQATAKANVDADLNGVEKAIKAATPR